jgi:hypothetical protein
VLSGRISVDGVESDAIRPGARLSVTGSVAAVIELPDTSRTELEPASEVVIHGRRGNARQMIELVKGGAKFQVEEGRGRFCVDTPVGLITVLGTEFTVKLRPREDALKRAPEMKARLAQVLAVAVISGSVEVDVGGEKYVLVGGESRAFAADDRAEGEGEREREGEHKRKPRREGEGERERRREGERDRESEGEREGEGKRKPRRDGEREREGDRNRRPRRKGEGEREGGGEREGEGDRKRESRVDENRRNEGREKEGEE